MTSPILLLIFNRLETTQKVIELLQEIKPNKLYIAGDGARNSVNGEREKCLLVRSFVLNAINWPCDVKTNFQETNLGCGMHVFKAINWFFEHVEEGIILEDDCIPHIDFFPFCSQLLEFYRNDKRIYTIGGNNFQSKAHGDGSYYLSTYGHIWGWATWRRAWQNYRFDLNQYPTDIMRKRLKKYFNTHQTFDYWFRIFHLMKQNPIDTWDYQWSFCQWFHNGLSIMPNVNLVENIGFGTEATHTKEFVHGISNRTVQGLTDLKHPSKNTINRKADLVSFYTNFEPKKKYYFWIKLREKIFYELTKLIPFKLK